MSRGQPPEGGEISTTTEAEQLGQPKVALAVAAVMAFLILVVLVATHGKQDDGVRRSRPIDKPPTTSQQ
ncbi:hypothetical protein [Nocardia sp. NPDC024068]|uniref:hypothetical protein n=1 Tax=Nocardia sp. NPDC024068 TaxID=3157197 RepID=UPI0033CE2D8B